MNIPLRVLIVEDSPDDAELILRELRRGGFGPTYQRVDSSAGVEAALETQTWDIIISDHSMPGFNGFDVLRRVRQKDVDLPFILVSGTIGEDTAVAAMKAGAHDYLMKDNLTRLAPAVERELREAKARRDRKGAEQDVARLAAIVASSDDPIVGKTLDGIVTSWNQAAERMFGYSSEEMIGQSIRRIFPPDRAQEEDEILARLRAGQPVEHYETVRLTKHGWQVPVSLTVSLIRDAGGKIIGASKIIHDIAERKKAEAELAAWHRELESRVEERTAELALAHQQLQAEVDERRRLEAEIADAVEREQLRLGQELHDGLGQQLRGIGFLLTTLQTKLKKLSRARARDASRLETMIVQSVEQVRILAKGFYPVELEANGLLLALEELARNTEQLFEVPCVLLADAPTYAELKGQLAIQLFRIAQEAVHNAVRHAKAKQIVILLTTLGGDLVLTVKDDGVGLPPDVDHSTGMGLRIMRYRARMIGGNLGVRNDDARGAIISCTVAGERKPPAQPPARIIAGDHKIIDRATRAQ